MSAAFGAEKGSLRRDAGQGWRPLWRRGPLKPLKGEMEARPNMEALAALAWRAKHPGKFPFWANGRYLVLKATTLRIILATLYLIHHALVMPARRMETIQAPVRSSSSRILTSGYR
jgi:hypothetical protein